MSSQSYLLTGEGGNQLLPALRRALTHATEIEIAVSFIRSTGLNLIFGDLESVLKSETRNVRLTLLTSDYMCITDPKALRKLMLLAERGADIRVFETPSSESFHLKAYIFVRSEQGEMISADAFVGSSNISAKALTDGLEWNYHLNYPNEADSLAEQRLLEIRREFRELLSKPPRSMSRSPSLILLRRDLIRKRHWMPWLQRGNKAGERALSCWPPAWEKPILLPLMRYGQMQIACCLWPTVKKFCCRLKRVSWRSFHTSGLAVTRASRKAGNAICCSHRSRQWDA
jgi:HKD family nuclease